MAALSDGSIGKEQAGRLGLGLCRHALFFGIAIIALPGTGFAADPLIAPQAIDRAEMLYNDHCIECHSSVVHVREARRVKTPMQLERYVRRWSGNQGLGWTESDVQDVSGYLNRRYYHFESAGTLTDLP